MQRETERPRLYLGRYADWRYVLRSSFRLAEKPTVHTLDLQFRDPPRRGPLQAFRVPAALTENRYHVIIVWRSSFLQDRTEKCDWLVSCMQAP